MIGENGAGAVEGGMLEESVIRMRAQGVVR
jgi:hypothetical protein